MHTWNPAAGDFHTRNVRWCSAPHICSQWQWEASAFGCSAISFLHVPVDGPLCCAVKHHLYVQIRDCFPFLTRILRPDLYNTALTPERGRGVWFLSVIFKWEALGLVLAIVSFLWVSQDLVILRFWFSRNLANVKAPVFVVWKPVLLVGVKEGKQVGFSLGY